MKNNGLLKLFLQFIIGLAIFLFLSNMIEVTLVLLYGGNPSLVDYFRYNLGNLIYIYIIGFTILFCLFYTINLITIKKLNFRLNNLKKRRLVYE